MGTHEFIDCCGAAFVSLSIFIGSESFSFKELKDTEEPMPDGLYLIGT